MIQVENLTYSYSPSGFLRDLEGVSFVMGKGENLALIGPSGAGKSTLLKCINRLLKPTEGKIKIEGRDILDCSEKETRRIRCKIAMIFQDYNLIQRSLTIDNVLLGRLGYLPFYKKYLTGFSYSKLDYEIALESLKQVEMQDFAYRRADNLSGGQQQRVGIARALTQRAKIILADEPVSNLDPNRKTEILNLLISICHNFNLTLVISMHEVELVKQYVSRVIGINEGRIVFDGTVGNLTKDKYEKIYA